MKIESFNPIIACNRLAKYSISSKINVRLTITKQVFVSASPEHWCRIPELENLTDLMSLEERKALSLPYTVKPDGRRIYSRCQMYDVNYTEIIDSWLQYANTLHNDTDTSSIISSSFHLPSRLPSPPVSNPDWPISKCQYGWIYDTKDYDSTLVTEVNSTFSL